MKLNRVKDYPSIHIFHSQQNKTADIIENNRYLIS